ncbi:hypothetical protein [Pelagibacterium sp.]
MHRYRAGRLTITVARTPDGRIYRRVARDIPAEASDLLARIEATRA